MVDRLDLQEAHQDVLVGVRRHLVELRPDPVERVRLYARERLREAPQVGRDRHGDPAVEVHVPRVDVEPAGGLVPGDVPGHVRPRPAPRVVPVHLEVQPVP